VVLASVLGDDDAPDEQPTARTVAVPPLGLAFSQPPGWQRTVEGRIIRVRSADGSTAVTFASPAAGRHNGRVKAALRRGLLRSLRPARVVAEGSGRLGMRRVTSLEVAGGAPPRALRALAIVDSTPYRTYAVTVVSPRDPARARLQEVRAILDSVRLSKPVRARRGR
jgi:hypothetical protein